MKAATIASVAAAATLTAAAGLNIVWFAGGGGSSEGMAEAGFAPDYALNHNGTALAMHQVNHPGCVHLCDDAFAAYPLTLEPGRKIRAFWASPDCTHFSVARGAAPKSPRIRGLAWCIIPWAKLRRPDVIFIENVKEFETWGPLAADGRPIAKRKGETFRRFIRRLEQCGYVVEWRVLNAADYGAPTTRRRLFIMARCDGRAIVWPERTHAPRREAAALGLKPYESAASIIDWSERCPSIFMSAAEAKSEGLKIKRPLVAATLSRIAKGIERYVVGSAEPFIVPLTHHGQRRIPQTTEPLPTITSAHRGELAVAAPTLAMVSNQYTSNTAGGRADLRLPKKTITSANHHALVEMPMQAATMVGLAHGEGQGSGRRDRDVTNPVNTIAAQGGDNAIVLASLGRQFGSNVAGNDIQDATPTVMSEGGGGKLSVIAASLTSYYGTGVGSDGGEPLRTVTGEHRHGVVATFLEQANTGMVGHDLRDGLSTITGRATQQRMIEARLSAIGAAPDSRRRAVLRFLWDHFGEPTEAEWAAPAATPQARLKFGLVILKGQVWEIADIGMRMLKVRELFSAQGFRPDYIIDRDPFGGRINATAATLMVGNSVPPPLARVLAAANLNTPEPTARRMAA